MNGFLPGIINYVRGNVNGGAVGGVNLAGNLDYGIQIGLFNYAGNTTGPYLQVGIINVTDERYAFGLNAGK